MTPDEIERIALSIEGVQAHPHFGAVSFRARKIFAVLRVPGKVTLGLPPEDQENLLALRPDALERLAGSSGAAGWTFARLDQIDAAFAEQLLRIAHDGAKPKGKRR